MTSQGKDKLARRDFLRAMGAGAGRVIAQTFEYGNAFLIVAGLLNMLVVLDAFDVAQGRK